MSDFTVEQGLDNDTWVVKLPHQCDAWEITNGDYEGVPHDQAVKELEQFLQDGQEALEALKARKETDSDSERELF